VIRREKGVRHVKFEEISESVENDLLDVERIRINKAILRDAEHEARAWPWKLR